MGLIKIQSVSDIITNSSSEVFIMKIDDAIDVCNVYAEESDGEITYSSILFNDISDFADYYLHYMDAIVFENSPLNDEKYKNLVEIIKTKYSYFNSFNDCLEEVKKFSEIWKNWCVENKNSFEDKISNLVELNIPDTFDAHDCAEDYAWETALSGKSMH